MAILFPLVVSAQSAKQHIKAGQQFLGNGMIEAAYEEFDQAIKLDAADGEAYMLKASVSLLKNDSLEAAVLYQKSAALNYLPEENYYKAATLFYNLSQTGDADACIESGLSIKPKSFDFLLFKTKLLFESGQYQQAYERAQEAVKAKDMGIAWYYSGASAHRLGQTDLAIKELEKSIIRDNKIALSFLELAAIQLEQKKYDYAIDNCSMVILLIDPMNVQALKLRSMALHGQKEYEQAIADITKAISIDKDNWELYKYRADYNFDYALYANAVDDYSLLLKINDTVSSAFKSRGLAYEKLNNKKSAIQDFSAYRKLLSDQNGPAGEISFAETKIFEIGRESNKPEITVILPVLNENQELQVKEEEDIIRIEGTLQEESLLSDFKINNLSIEVKQESPGTYSFEVELPASETDYLTFSASDIYENISSVSYPVSKIETQSPIISLISPVAEANHIIRLESGDNSLYIEGRVEDKSNITKIQIDEVNASFAPGDYNPRFTGTIDIRNRRNITVTATDKFGNTASSIYEFARDGKMLNENNPMGKTWVVVIENSDYNQFPNLKNPENDVKSLVQALDRYKISKVLVKKNMSKREMERFFALDLRDLILANHVNSLMIWYAGHGKNMQNTGYWIPVDGRLNDEYSFYNINALKASLYSYSSLTHILVVSDACEAGESFTVAMRGDNSLASCDNLNLINQKSALVLTSSNTEAAMDNSLFASTFANTLANNPADCIPIDAIAERISIVMYKHTAQKPQFGRIAGLEDKNGTFFFISK
ncbi:MAG: caspase family protein [Bacteroidales bacterium]|nr:caspase family protein [Bacteroidales bacterium]